MEESERHGVANALYYEHSKQRAKCDEGDACPAFMV
jgi:hypothetical protein